MHVDLSQLEADELHLEHRYQDSFELPEEELRLKCPPTIELWLRRATSREVRVRGRVSASLEVPCDRCLSTLPVPVDVSFDLFYAPIETLTPDQDVPLTSRELDYGFYRDDTLDIDSLVKEQIFLAIPFRRLCQPDCRGLCQHCGANLNQHTCSCLPDEVAPHWKALMELKKKTEH